MRYNDIKEGVGRITKQNQTVDVGPSEIKTQAAKFGNKVDKDGRPPTLSKKVKGSKTNVLFNLGMSESISVDNLYENVLYFRQMKENLGEIAQATEIYVDMDGVLADFFGEWARLMKVDHFTKIDKEHDINDALQKILDTDEFWLNLPLLPQAKQLLSVIKQIKGEYNICSSPLANDPNSEPHKREWIKRNLAFFPPKEVIITHNKPQYATKQDGTPNILIDDYGVNVDAWEAAGGTAFKYKDHKFERTAKAIQQHLNAKVHETMIRGKTANRHIHYDPLYKGLENYDGKHLMNDADAIEALLYGRGFSQREDAFRDLLIRKYKITRETDIGALLKSIRDQLEAKNRQHVKDRDAENAKYENFADGKKKGKSRPGRVKRAGASCNGSVTELRAKAKKASGERAKMYHWCANMKSGRS